MILHTSRDKYNLDWEDTYLTLSEETRMQPHFPYVPNMPSQDVLIRDLWGPIYAQLHLQIIINLREGIYESTT